VTVSWPGADAVGVLRRADVAIPAAKAGRKGPSARYELVIDVEAAVA
jgi:hypothetical protein